MFLHILRLVQAAVKSLCSGSCFGSLWSTDALYASLSPEPPSHVVGVPCCLSEFLWLSWYHTTPLGSTYLCPCCILNALEQFGARSDRWSAASSSTHSLLSSLYPSNNPVLWSSPIPVILIVAKQRSYSQNPAWLSHSNPPTDYSDWLKEWTRDPTAPVRAIPWDFYTDTKRQETSIHVVVVSWEDVNLELPTTMLPLLRHMEDTHLKKTRMSWPPGRSKAERGERSSYH